jgi:hypothetical protein
VTVTAAAPVIRTAMTVTSVTSTISGSNLVVVVTVKDNLGRAVSGATVAATVHRNGASTAYRSLSGRTGTTGTVTFTVRSVPTGCYSTKVTSLVSGSLTWDRVTPHNVTSPCR